MASPRRKHKGVKKLKKILGNKKGIQTILAALLMVVIVVVASVMVYAWSTGLLGGLLVTPTTGKEALNMESSAFPSAAPSNVTINIRNTGTASIALVTYYVKDATGNTWTLASWAGPTIAVNQVATTNFAIGTTWCPSCTSSGSGFTIFTAGNSYTVTVVTSRNNQFVFTVVHP